MASFTGKAGKCSNFGNCSLADARTTIEVPNGQDFVCTECGKPLLLMDAGPQGGGNSKALAVGALLLVLLLAAGDRAAPGGPGAASAQGRASCSAAGQRQLFGVR